ncbi:MAG: response regulator [Desulfopila sp.]|jgi:PleD family two-component response regulator|nr:response regulator [Desulfopila sp.]
MKQILLVEDSTMFGKLTKAKLEAVFHVPVCWVKTLAETIAVLDSAKNTFSMAALDFNLPDAPQGEAIDEVVARGISVLVFTSNITEEIRSLVWSKKVADYILKDDPSSIEYLIMAMKRMEKNIDNLILVVDDSDGKRAFFSELLYVRQYRVITAKSGEEALAILQKYQEIKMVVTQYYLPDMDGWLFCRKVRETFKRDQLAIVGIVSRGGKNIGIRFIKSGATDFILEDSFMVEEFYCRVDQCMEMINLFQLSGKPG